MFRFAVLTGNQAAAYPWGWYYQPFFFFFWVAFVVFFVTAWILFWRFRWRYGWGCYRAGAYFVPGADSAMEILRIRFARGEISREEFEELKEKIGHR